MYDILGWLCHQRPDRCLEIQGHLLPLCAHCTGIYAGLLLGGLACLVRRRPLPSPVVWGALPGLLALPLQVFLGGDCSSLGRALLGLLFGGSASALLFGRPAWRRLCLAIGLSFLALAAIACGGGDHLQGPGMVPTWLGLGNSAWGVAHVTRVRCSSSEGGGISDDPAFSFFPAIAISPQGVIMAAWESDDFAGNSQIYLRSWDGTDWLELGGSGSGAGISNTFGSSRSASLALPANGFPVVAWSDNSSGTFQIYVRQWNGTAWVEMGGSATGGGVSGSILGADYPSLAVDSQGRPVVCWADPSAGNYEIYLRAWDGSAWVELDGSAAGGGISANLGISYVPSLVIDSDDRPVVAWHDSSAGPNEIYLRRWDGAAWVEVGGSASGGGLSDTPGWSYAPSLVLDSSGRPVVSWGDDSWGNLEIYLKRWDGAAWVDVGGSATNGGVSDNFTESIAPSLALDALDRPVIAWGDMNGFDRRIFLRLWDGTAWIELGGSGTGTGLSGGTQNGEIPALALDPLGVPVVTWASFTLSGPEIYVSAWTGAQWSGYGGSGSSGGMTQDADGSFSPSLAYDAQGNPCIAWAGGGVTNNEVYLRKWNGSAWEELGGSATAGGISATGGQSYLPGVALDSLGRPAVVWQDDDSGRHSIYLRRWNGVAWEELGGSGSGGGLSNSAGRATAPDMELDASGNPWVVWEDDSLGPTEIYLRYWDGAAWVELGGSATSGGVSGTPSVSSSPSIAMDALGRPWVAWQDISPGNSEVYLRRWDGAAWVEVGGSASGGGISDTAEASTQPRLSLDRSGQPLVVWVENSGGNQEIFARGWNGGAWAEIGGSASMGGISRSAGASDFPSLSLDSGGRAVVAWEDWTNGNPEIYVRHWAGAGWQEIGSGSGGPGGVSNAQGTSVSPSVAVRGSTAGVAWVDWGTGGTDIYFRSIPFP